MEDLIYKIALTLIPGVGSVNGRNLLAYCGGVEAVFKEKKRTLMKIPGIGEQIVNSIEGHKLFERAEEEIEFIEKFRIEAIFCLDAKFPSRLKACTDSPLMIYFKGSADLNAVKSIALVGTRNGTEYGLQMCRKLIEGLAELDVLIVSGLAYGIDTWSHKAALDNNLNTVGILGHSLDRIYPFANRSLAEKMVSNGGILTEFVSGTKPDRENFPKRNRIIAGMVDAVIVVEAGRKGGALITAEIANSYNRDVFAVPGRVGDLRSEGCNDLIKKNKAALIETAEDVRYLLNWDIQPVKKRNVQRQLFIELSPEEGSILNILRNEGDQDIDSLLAKTSLTPSKAAGALLRLEFEDIIKCLPGKVYKLI